MTDTLGTTVYALSVIIPAFTRMTAAIIQAVRKSEAQKMKHARKNATQVIHTARAVE